MTVKAHLAARGMTMRQGTTVHATLIGAPTSTNNKEGKRDPEMHQTKKGNSYDYGMKVHVGVDKDSGLIHSVVTTAANVHDLNAPFCRVSASGIEAAQAERWLRDADRVVCLCF